MINLNDGYTVIAPLPRFQTGQVIQHTLYSYRGLIVELDKTCQAADDWYQSNQTQPERNQPWYHVLVDGNHNITYVAESNLRIDSYLQR